MYYKLYLSHDGPISIHGADLVNGHIRVFGLKIRNRVYNPEWLVTCNDALYSNSPLISDNKALHDTFTPVTESNTQITK